MQRMIYVSGYDQWVTVGQYVQAIKTVKANPMTAIYPRGLTCWWPVTGAEIMKQFSDSIHDRINQGIPYTQRGIA